MGTDVVDLKTRASQPIKLPTYKDESGQDKDMRFAAASADGQTYLVVGQGLHVATAGGKVVRRLSAPDARLIDAGVRLSPDGMQAVYATFNAADQSQQLSVVPLAGCEPRELVPVGKLTDMRALWSPDGKRIAYTSRLLDPGNPFRSYGTETYLKLVDTYGVNAVTLLTEKVHPNGTSLELTAWR